MQKIALTNTVPSIAASGATPGTPGWFTDGVPPGTGPSEIGADWFNSVQEELVALIEGAGGTVHSTGVFGPQIFDIYCGALALVAASGASGMALQDSHWKRALLASTNSAANGADAAVIASVGSSTGPSTSEAAVIASYGTITDTAEQAAIVAAYDSTIDGTSARSAIVGAQNCGITDGGNSAICGGSYVTLTGNTCGALGVGNSTIEGAYCGIVASQTCTIAGGLSGPSRAAIVGSLRSVVSKSTSVCLASDGVELARQFSVGGGYSGATVTPSGSNQNLNWRLDSDTGDITGSGTVATGDANADYAELFENCTDGALPVGALVARVGQNVKLAGAGDRVVGVVSAAPAVLGNAAVLHWSGKHKRGEFGERIMETRPDGAVVPVLADGFDPSVAYTPRTARPDQWTAVGLVGQLRVRVDASVAVDADVVAGAGGIGTTFHGRGHARGAQVECMAIVSPFDAVRGYAIALCLVR